MNRMTMVIVLACICGVIGGCTDTGVCPDDDSPRPLTASERQVVNSYNAFGLNLFKEIAEQEADTTNVFTSPVSVSLALGMTLNGAAGTTEDAMKSTLEFPDLEMDDVNECYSSLINLLTGLDPEVQFDIANSVWYRSGFVFEEDFLDRCRTYFNAEVTGLDFGRPDAANTINAWVDEKTNGKINKIMNPPIHPLTVMFLINAIYFKGTWTYEFDPDLTGDDVFILPDGSAAPCSMMQRPGPDAVCEYSYFSNDELQAIDLPYADGWFSMTVVLPRPGVDIGSLIAGLNEEAWEVWTGSLAPQEGHLLMPRFEIEYGLLMNDVLTALGMGIAFDSAEADFTRMHRQARELWLHISKVMHKTYVKVDEVGTEAAAATSVEMQIESTHPDLFEMRVDRPFIFAIREHHTGTILFMGKIVNPGHLR
jgi:serine protease inhibitor